MKASATSIDGVALLEFERSSDDRGSFARLFCRSELAGAGIDFAVVQENISFNPHALTLRGMHLQRNPHGEAKIVTCLRGRIYDVAVDLRPNSATYLGWTAAELAGGVATAFYLPRGIAHGFLSLEANSLVHYLMDAPYEAAAAAGFRWDDPALAIDWPAAPQVISERDRNHPLIAR